MNLFANFTYESYNIRISRGLLSVLGASSAELKFRNSINPSPRY